MATATRSTNRSNRSNATKRTSGRKAAAPKVSFEKFEFGELDEFLPLALAGEMDAYIEFCDSRRAIAQDPNKAQYWNGQRQAVIAMRQHLVAPFLEVEDGADDEAVAS
jgi:hypothetical protein